MKGGSMIDVSLIPTADNPGFRDLKLVRLLLCEQEDGCIVLYCVLLFFIAYYPNYKPYLSSPNQLMWRDIHVIIDWNTEVVQPLIQQSGQEIVLHVKYQF